MTTLTDTATSRDAVTLGGVSKAFGTLPVLGNIDLRIGHGEILAMVGPSGCGKSTLLNIISGLLPPDSGSIAIDGLLASGAYVNASRTEQRFENWQSIAYMFQEDRLLPWRNARDNVAFGLEAQSIPKAERMERVDAVLALVGLKQFAKAYPHELSGGMRSRLALARSLVVEPSILLMDEPFSKLDPQTRTQMHDEVLRIQAIKKTTVVFVTHDVEEAIVLADRIVVLAPHPGRIKSITQNALARPREATNPSVAEAIRTLRMEI